MPRHRVLFFSIPRNNPIAGDLSLPDHMDIGAQYTSRRRAIRELTLPYALPTKYSRSPSRRSGNTTTLDPTQVTQHRVPTQFRLDDTETMLAPMVDALRRSCMENHFPDHLFHPDGRLAEMRADAQWMAQTAQPSGETGVSHLLQVALFQQLEKIAREYFPDQTRVWRVIGTGKTGKADRGLYINGVLVLVVELKPHTVCSRPQRDLYRTQALTRCSQVVNTASMRNILNMLAREPELEDSWATGTLNERVCFQASSQSSRD